MKYAKQGAYAVLGAAVIFILSLLAASFGKTEKYDPVVMSSWVQAFGTVGAILGAIWIATQSERNADGERARVFASEAHYIAQDVFSLLDFHFVDPLINGRDGYKYARIEAEFEELLARLSWARRRARNEEDLASISQMRTALMGSVRLIQRNRTGDTTVWALNEQEEFGRFHAAANDALNHWTAKRWGTPNR